MVIVDTNILVYLLIEGDRTRDAQALYARDPDWHSDAFILIEFSNVLATYCRAALLNTESSVRQRSSEALGAGKRPPVRITING